MTIIGGTVRYEDGIKTTTGDQFSPTRKVAVELNFAIEEGADAIVYVQNVLDTAIALTNSKLGLKVPTAAAVATTAPVEQPKRAPGRPKKVEPPKTDPAEMSDPDPTPAQPATPAATRVSAEPAASNASGEDPAAMSEEFVAEPLAPEITDADLNKAIQVVNAKIKAPQKIKELMHAFNPDTTKQMTVRAIPQAQRKSFIDKLNALS